MRIVVEDLKYRYPLSNRLALDGVSFSVAAGECIGVIGRNQAGKSTLCQALAGLVPHFFKGAYGGRVCIDDLEVGKCELSELALKVGIVFQNPFTQMTGAKLTVYEEVAFGLENMGLTQQEMIRRIDYALDLLGITLYRDRNPFELSGGQMQRLAIASIIAMKPDVIVLDEPTSQLDPQGSDEVFQAVRTLSREGMTVIIAEHKMEKIAAYTNRVLLLAEGKMIDFDSPQKVFSRSDLSDYGIQAPVFAQICRRLAITDPASGLYPVTLDGAYEAVVETTK